MNFDAVILQLKNHAPIFGGRVAGGGVFDETFAAEVQLAPPAAFVVPLDEDADENQSPNALKQIVTEHVGIIVMFDSSEDRRLQGMTRLYDEVRRQIWAALLNWQLDPIRASRGLEYAGGVGLSHPNRARFFYQWSFSQQLTITAADGWKVPTTPLLEIDLELQRAGRTVAEARFPLPQS